MELRNLRHLVTLSRRLSYSRAAEDLGLSQSALTRSIQALEKQIGMRLFDRDRAGVRLTPQGRVVAERAGALLADAEEFTRQIQRAAHGAEGRIRFGMPPLPAWTLLPAAMIGQVREVPGLTNEVVVRPIEGLWPLLLAGEIEFLVSADGQIPDAPRVKAELLGHFPVTLIVRDGHPLLSDATISTQFPVLLSARSPTGALPSELLAYASGQPHVIEDYRTLIMLTQSTDAIWLSSAYAVAEQLEAGVLKALPGLDGGIGNKFRMMMYTLDRRTQSPGALRLKDAFRQRIRDLEGRA